MTEDSFVEAIDRVSDAGRQACDAIEAALGALDVGREARQSGATLAQVVDLLMSGGGREIRIGSAKAFTDYERAIAAMRALVVRALVDEEGMSFTDIAARLHISRQAAAVLYKTTLQHVETARNGHDAPRRDERPFP